MRARAHVIAAPLLIGAPRGCPLMYSSNSDLPVSRQVIGAGRAHARLRPRVTNIHSEHSAEDGFRAEACVAHGLTAQPGAGSRGAALATAKSR